MPDFLRALDGCTASRLVLIATKLLIFREVVPAVWSEFDLDNAIWEIPAESMKKRRSHLVPLSVQGVDLLNELEIRTGDNRYVFSAAR